MILIPLPFFVSVMLVGLLARALGQDEDGVRPNPLFTALLAAYAVQSLLIGMRWGYGLREVLPLMSPLAALIAPLAWASFRSLADGAPSRGIGAVWPHALPAALVIVLEFVWPDPIGAVIVTTFMFYGAALLWQARLGPDALVASRLDGVVRSYRAMQITGLALLASAATDIFTSIDLAWSGGAYSGAVIGVANVVALLILGKAASIATSATPNFTAPEPVDHALPGTASPGPTVENRAVTARVEALMRDESLYRDLELNLGRIARKLRMPARDVSNAINRSHGMSVSQYVNTFRVEHACKLLSETREPVTKIMFEAGFLTKSNFNREFLRVTGTSPTAWRHAKTPGLRGDAGIVPASAGEETARPHRGAPPDRAEDTAAGIGGVFRD